MNPHYWPGKFTQAIHIMATGEGKIQKRLHEALLRVDGLDVNILDQDDRAGWIELMKLTSGNTKTLGIRYATAYRAARILFELYEHVALQR